MNTRITTHLTNLHKYAIDLLIERDQILTTYKESPLRNAMLDHIAEQYALIVQQLVITIHHAHRDVTVLPLNLKPIKKNETENKIKQQLS